MLENRSDNGDCRHPVSETTGAHKRDQARIRRVISGGQTGADRAGLDAAIQAGVPVGGYCPSGRRSEDGVIPDSYPLEEIQGGYRQRTRKNVEAADGTVIFYDRMPTGGTALTIAFCLKLKKPFKLIDRDLVSASQAAGAIRQFLAEHNVACLNVAGPREGGCPGIYDYVLESMCRVLAPRLREPRAGSQ